MDWLSFDTSAFILTLLDHHWLLLGFVWGAFKIIAKRTETTFDDELVNVIKDLKNRKTPEEQKG